MSSRRLDLLFDAQDPERLARFWATVLDREVVEDRQGVLLPGTATQVGLGFETGSAAKAGMNRLHLHVTSASLGDQERQVAAALELGASHLDVGQRQDEGHIVLADPEGNEFCVIEPDNAYLAGCGPLGEVTCDGTREVGLFWAGALGWPLVWDQDQETAVQSPQGGTKIAWSGTPAAQRSGRTRQRFDLRVVGTDPTAEVDRLAALGATRLSPALDGAVALVDPDGNEFRLTVA